MNNILTLGTIFLSFIAGTFLGANSSLESQMYYDAPNKIKILSHQLDQNASKDEVFGQIITQARILHESDQLKFKNKFILKFFPDGGLLALQFEENYPEVEKSIHYQEALRFLCKWNEKYKDKCKKSL